MRRFGLLVIALLSLVVVNSVAAATEFHLTNNPGDVTDCVGDEFHFVINQLDDGPTDAPAFITVTWSDNSTTQVPLDNVNQSQAGYTDTAHVGLTVLDAVAVLPDDWSGQFVLSHIPCEPTPTPTETPTETATSPVTETPVSPTSTPRVVLTNTPPLGPGPNIVETPVPPREMPDTGSGPVSNAGQTVWPWLVLLTVSALTIRLLFRRNAQS